MLVLVQGQKQHWFMTSVPYISDIARWTLAFSSRWQVCVSCCHMSTRVGIGIHMAHFLGHIQCCCIGHFVTELGVSFAFVLLCMHVKRSGKVCSISALHPPPVFNWDILSLTYFSNNPCGTINFLFFFLEPSLTAAVSDRVGEFAWLLSRTSTTNKVKYI